MPVASAQEALGLPGGATALRETHDDWTVARGVQAGRGKVRVRSQEPVDRRSRRRAVAIELRRTADARVI